jgi:hypothetical protein
MILYHHTDPKYLPSILEKGLLARPWTAGKDDPEEAALLSAVLHNRDVVWLTTQPSTEATEADAAWCRKRGWDDQAADKHWLYRNNGNTVRLVVSIPKYSKRLVHYLTWVKKNEAMIVFEDGSCRCSDDGELMTTANLIPDPMPAVSDSQGKRPMQQLEQVSADTARRLAGLSRRITRRHQQDADLIDGLRRILESPNPQAVRLRQLIKEIVRA